MLVLIAVLRIFVLGEHRVIIWNIFDKAVIAWAICGAVVYVIQWADTRSLIYKSGFLFDIFGQYWIFRQAIRSWEDVRSVISFLAVCVIAITPFVLFEFVTHQNVFVMLGTVVTEERMGRFRCQASFPISILLGLFWAILFPIFIGMGIVGRDKMLYMGAAISSVFMVIASASSTPLLTWLVITILLCMFKWRKYTFLAWKLLLLFLIGLHIVMKAPVWHLIARIKFVEGSTGWHRFYLIDQAITHFGEWALIGTRSTANWGYGLVDVTNQYVLEGVRGGAITLVLFLTMLVIAFHKLGLFLKEHHYRDRQILVWCIFVSLFGHCIAFLGVSYFGQIGLLWYLTLAVVAFVAEAAKKQEGISWLLHSREPGGLTA
jgi:hypothetical protein